MQVKDFLPCIAFAIDDETVATLGNALLRSNLLRHDEHVPKCLLLIGRDIVHSGDFDVRDDEDMHRGKRVNIFKGGHTVILINNGGWEFVGDDFGKDGGHCEGWEIGTDYGL